nr:unnamed protein product [Digitaria exilis]
MVVVGKGIHGGCAMKSSVVRRGAENGAARPSNAALRSGTFSGETSAVDSAPSGSPSTAGRSSVTTRTRGDSSGGTGRSLAAFLGVDTKVMAWPRRASRFESSRNGIMWPNASHGKTTMWSGDDDAASAMAAGSMRIES